MRNNPCPHEAGLTKLTHPTNYSFLCPKRARRSPTPCPGSCTHSKALFFFYTSMVEVYGTTIRPSGRYQRPLRWTINAAMTSPGASHRALAFAEFRTRNNVRHFSGICATRFPPMTSHAHRACSRRVRLVPGTRSAHSADRTRGMQHMVPRTRVPVFQIHLTTLAILTIHAAGLCPTWNVSGPDREGTCVPAVHEVRHGPRTRRRVNPAR